ncbi:RluA family pseudouridine synthase [Tepidibacillus infernus]|uniref:Pseudouridine synthase n=1 Tax=Tepidibacillus decaturensis TaxID=1413211 RepID=A0A135L216_9BACI|nr:RluA family pseudouridine synthase [Tepidibacillus decaturensis]KXG43006.1 hypothetical protein U473_02420 [Tepidibacillus decaturensis]
MKELMNVTIPIEWEGMMIKEILFDHYHFSRKSLSKIKTNNGIYLNGKAVYVSTRVKQGDQLRLLIPIETSFDILPQPIPLDIRYEDQDVIVINKPAGIVVHPTRNHYLGTIANGLMHYWNEKGDQCRFRPVHRLDKDTTGLFVVAKNQYAHHQLALQLHDRSLKRTYLALVHGYVTKEKGVIDAPIMKDPNHAIKRIVVTDQQPEAKSAITYYKTIESFTDFSLLELLLATGRTHQIRVHMSWINHPLVGDELYGGKTGEHWLNHQALHASKLSFYHPITREYLTFQAELPTDMQTLIFRAIN